MTASRHLIALLKSHIDGDDEHFLSVAMQVAAHEARQGHGKLTQELRDLVDDARQRSKERGKKPVPLAQPKGELASLVSVSYSDTRLSSMVLPEELEERLKRVLTEQRQQHRLRNHGLVPRRKLLLKNRLATFGTEQVDWESVVKSTEGMSQSELARAADDAAKRAVLAERTVIVQDDLGAAIAERKAPTRT